MLSKKIFALCSCFVNPFFARGAAVTRERLQQPLVGVASNILGTQQVSFPPPEMLSTTVSNEPQPLSASTSVTTLAILRENTPAFEQYASIRPVSRVTVRFMSQAGQLWTVDIPLRTRVTLDDFSMLPDHPFIGQIIGLSTLLPEDLIIPYGLSIAFSNDKQTDLSSIVCVAYPESSAPPQSLQNLRRRWHAGTGGLFSPYSDRVRRPVWWTAHDGGVNFEDARGRFWLRGAAVGGYECF